MQQLIGQFLLLRGPGVTCVAHVQAFNDWLAAQGVNAYRSGGSACLHQLARQAPPLFAASLHRLFTAIVRCIAEKVDTMIPGSFDATAFAE